MARRIGTVSGIALRPGVSRNGRLYTKEMIAGAVERAQGRLAESGALPLVDRRPLDQRTHHAADDDSTRVIGRVTSLSLEADGSARFTADLADTEHGRTIAALIAPKGDGPDEVEPFLKGVSIRGAWVGRPKRVQHEGQTVETADGLEIDGLDYTARPGVHGAEIDDFTPAGGSPAAGESEPVRALIFESVQEATVTIDEADSAAKSKAPYGDDANYADPGYQKDKKKRYPLNTKQRAKSAWSYINQADNARQYTSAQLKRIKQRIIKALKGYGVTVATQERWLIEPARQVTETLAECWDMDPAEGSLYLSLTNGPTTVTVSSRILDAHDLDLVGRAAMAGACDALLALDPDLDADIDVPGAEGEDTDGDLEDDQAGEGVPGSACPCGCGCAVPHPMAVADGCPCACGCQTCHATSDAPGESGEESAPDPVTVSGTVPVDGRALHQAVKDAALRPEWAPAGAHLQPEQLEALKATGFFERLEPGTVVTAAMVDEALAHTPAESAADPTHSEETPAMAESTTPAAETTDATEPSGVTALGEKIDKLSDALAGFITAMTPKPAESAPAAPVAETTAPVAPAAPAAPAAVAESDEERIARLVAEQVAAAKAEMVQETVERYGPPSRKGLVTETGNTDASGGVGANGLPEGWPDKPLHQYTREERAQYLEPVVLNTFLGSRLNRG